MLEFAAIEKFLLEDLGKLGSAFEGTAAWRDEITALPAHQLPHDQSRLTLSSTSKNAYIYRRLGHLAVNPSRASNTAALLGSYTFPASSSADGGKIANASDAAAHEFAKSLVELSKEQWRLWNAGFAARDSVEYQLDAPNLTLLFGERGCGKTFFLNYLLSRFHREFDEKCVVWVRLDLTQKFFLTPEDNEAVPIEDWVYAQATKILYRYYDRSSPLCDGKLIPLDIDSFLQGHIDGLRETPERQEWLHEKRRKLREVFPIRHEQLLPDATGSRVEVPLSQGLVPADLGLAVVNYAMSRGYSFIVVFDGLDVLDSTLREHKTFLLYNAAVQRLARDHGRLGMTYVVTMRMHQGAQQYQSQYDVAPDHSFLVASVEVEQILAKRLEFIATEKQYIDGLGFPVHLDLVQHLTEFAAHLRWTEEETEGHAQFLHSLSTALGTNTRAQMQLTQIRYADFAISSATQPYKIIEALVTEDEWFPPRRYEYQLDHAGFLVPRRLGSRRFDNRFLPIIYRFPTEAATLLADVVLDSTYILLGLRLLQVACAPVRLRRSRPLNRYADLTARELATVLNQLFGYDIRVVYGMIQEFSEYELFWLRGYAADAPATVDRAFVTPLPKAEWLLGIGTSDIAYLNLAAMRVPVRTPGGASTPRMFRAMPLPMNGHGTPMTEWVTCKIMNALMLVRLINTLSTRQVSRVEQWRFDNSKGKNRRLLQCVDEAINAGMFSETLRVKNFLAAQAIRIANDVARRHGVSAGERLVERLSGFIEATT